LEFEVLKALLRHLRAMGNAQLNLASFEEDTKMGIDNLSLLFSTFIFGRDLTVSPALSTTSTANSLLSFTFLKKAGGNGQDSEISASSSSPSPVLTQVDLVLPDLINFYPDLFNSGLKLNPSPVPCSNSFTNSDSSSDTDSDTFLNSLDLARSISCTTDSPSNYSKPILSLKRRPKFSGSKLQRMFSLKSIKNRMS
jgi:hypothetical protein